jgi:phospholipid-transporting ATPase
MSSDFERLVSQANPAARQGSGRANNPPRQSLDHDNPFLIDDLDDFDDTPVTDHRYQNRQPQHAGSSVAHYANDRQAATSNPLDDDIDVYDQNQHLTRGPSTKSKRSAHGTGQPEGWIFDVDDHTPNNLSTTTVNGNGLPFPGSKMFNGTINESSEGLRVGGRPSSKKKLLDFKKNWKWPWEKEKVLVGERIVFLNDDGANSDSSFVSNYVSTSKYNLVTFTPKFLFGRSPFQGIGWFSC